MADEVKTEAPPAAAPIAMSSGAMPAPNPMPGPHVVADSTAPAEEPVNHLNEIAALAYQIRKASPSRCETISDQILLHVSALMSVG